MKSYNHLYEKTISETNRRYALSQAKHSKRFRKIMKHRHMSDDAAVEQSLDSVSYTHLFTKLTDNAKHVISTGVALVAIGAAMKIFASAVKDFSGMQWDEIARGLVAMAGALAAVTIAVNFMPKSMIGIGTGLIAVSAALLILANALNQMGSMSWEEIAKGLITLGLSLIHI